MGDISLIHDLKSCFAIFFGITIIFVVAAFMIWFVPFYHPFILPYLCYITCFLYWEIFYAVRGRILVDQALITQMMR